MLTFRQTSERLILRRYRQEDLQDLYEYLSDQEVVEYEPYKPLTFDETKKNLQWRISFCTPFCLLSAPAAFGLMGIIIIYFRQI